MAIQHRRGNEDDLDENKLLPGEFAFTLDTGKLYYCYGAGLVKRLTTIEDLQFLLDTSPEAYNALQELISDLEADPSLSTTILNDIDTLKQEVDTLQEDKLDKTGDSKDNVVSFTDAEKEEDITSGETHTTIFGKILKSIKTFRTNIGILGNLLTTDKSNLVSALNEIHKNVDTHLAKTVYQGVHGLEIEEGPWTPEISAAAGEPAGSHTYTYQIGRYKRIGNMVIATFFIELSKKDTAMSGTAYIKGLPFKTNGSYSANIGCYSGLAGANGNGISGRLYSNSTYIQLVTLLVDRTSAISTDVITDTTSFIGEVTYFIDL